jgi:hypothetical protein
MRGSAACEYPNGGDLATAGTKALHLATANTSNLEIAYVPYYLCLLRYSTVLATKALLQPTGEPPAYSLQMQAIRNPPITSK